MTGKSLTMLAVGMCTCRRSEVVISFKSSADIRKGMSSLDRGVLFTDRGVKTFVENFPAPAGHRVICKLWPMPV